MNNTKSETMPTIGGRRVGFRKWPPFLDNNFDHIEDDKVESKCFSIDGHSMTSKKFSIPNGSVVFTKKIRSRIDFIPRFKPVVIEYSTPGFEGNEPFYIVCKVITDIDIKTGKIKCESYNPAPEFEPFWIWIEDLMAIYEVESVLVDGVKKMIINY